MNPRLTTLFETGGATGGGSVSSSGAVSAQPLDTLPDHGTFAPDALATSPSMRLGAATPSAARTGRASTQRDTEHPTRDTLAVRVV